MILVFSYTKQAKDSRKMFNIADDLKRFDHFQPGRPLKNGSLLKKPPHDSRQLS